MAKANVNRIKTTIWILFAAVFISYVISFLFPQNLTVGIFTSLIIFGGSIAILVESIRLVKRKQLAFGITFLVLSSLIILFYILMFVIGFIIGFLSVYQNVPIS